MAPMSADELNEIYAFAVGLGKEAGAMLMSLASSRFGDNGAGEQSFVEKDSAVDIVTKADEGTYAHPAKHPLPSPSSQPRPR